jgi:hypothetical protein
LRLQLLSNPFFDAETANALDITGPRTERQPVQCVEDLLFRGEFLVEPAGGDSRQRTGRGQQSSDNQPRNSAP